jgi:hypothetical protein
MACLETEQRLCRFFAAYNIKHPTFGEFGVIKSFVCTPEDE